MKNPTSSLSKLSIFSSPALQNTKLNVNVKAPSLTAVATAVGVSLPTSIASINPVSLTMYLMCILLGTAYLPGFTSGLLIGPLLAVVSTSIALILHYIKPINTTDSRYYHFIADNPLTVTLTAPVIEEILFRGLLLPAALAAVITLFPLTTTMMFWGTGISLAAAISISTVAVLFGMMHLSNEHEGAYRQAFITTLTGIALGVIALEFGLWAAIGAHVINNSIVYASISLSNLSFFKPFCSSAEQAEESDMPELSFVG